MGPKPRAYLTAAGAVEEAAIETDIGEFVDEHGFTGFHITGDGDWFDGDNPDIGVCRALETVVRKVHARGGACHIWLWGSGSNTDHGRGPAQLAGGVMSEEDRRHLRYLADRLGPIPGWTIGYGLDTENGWASRAELSAWKTFLEGRMGWDHFIGARVGFDEKGLFALRPRPPRPPSDAGNRSPIDDKYTTWLGGDYIGYTSYRPLYPRSVQAMQHHPDRPSFEEDRFRLRNLRQWTYKDYNEELTRRGLWHSALAGGVANIWGNLLPEPSPRGGSRPYRIKDQIKTYSLFLAKRFLKEIRTEFIGPELQLATPDRSHVIVYREDADQVQFDQSRAASPLKAFAVDARVPYREIELGTIPAAPYTWKAPHRSNWVIAIGSF